MRAWATVLNSRSYRFRPRKAIAGQDVYLFKIQESWPAFTRPINPDVSSSNPVTRTSLPLDNIIVPMVLAVGDGCQFRPFTYHLQPRLDPRVVVRCNCNRTTGYIGGYLFVHAADLIDRSYFAATPLRIGLLKAGRYTQRRGHTVKRSGSVAQNGPTFLHAWAAFRSVIRCLGAGSAVDTPVTSVMS